MTTPELEGEEEFVDAAAFEAWIATRPDGPGTWLRIAKKGSGVTTVSYLEALDVALCWGWIDGQKRSWDATYFLQRFVPRRARSTWSKVNVAKVVALTEAGRMQPRGLAEVAAAQPTAGGTRRTRRPVRANFPRSSRAPSPRARRRRPRGRHSTPRTATR
ncbi:MAG: bacteriocin-protection protein [Thermoleophilia bacterium]|nr:bacteriocin-protection protein [Thermoleophilia bacterium]